MKVTSILNGFFKSYVYTRLAGDVTRFLRNHASDIDLDFDKEKWLHRAGLDVYRPGKGTAGAFGFFALGALAGAAIGLALATKTGSEFRNDLKDRASDLLGQAQGNARDANRPVTSA